MADDEDYAEGHDVVVQKELDCPECGKDNVVLYADGHKHCFSPDCNYHTGPDGETPRLHVVGGKEAERRGDEYALLSSVSGSFTPPPSSKRGLKMETLKRFGVFYHPFRGANGQVYPYYNQDGELCAQKVRLPGKDFPVLKDGERYPGKISKCHLFGRHVWGDKYDRQVVITEGELDAMSVAQATGFKLAAVSISAGADKAADTLKANYLWLDRFNEIILWMDDDEAGHKAIEACAQLFKAGKVRIAKVDGCKDASDVLKAGRPGDIQTAIYAATTWKRRGIVNAKDNAADVTAPEEDTLVFPYPPQFEKLNQMTGGGMAKGDVVYHVAGTGVGKSTGLREIQYHLIEQGVKFAVLSFEDTIRDMKQGLMSIHVSERIGLIPVPDKGHQKARDAYNKRMVKIHEETFGSGCVELFDPETAEWTMEAILGYVRYCAKALECEVVFIDPISFVAAGISLNADERRALDAVAAEFAKMAKELGIHIEISHHLKRKDGGVPHEEGAPTSLNELRSSGGLANFAMCVVGWERNNQAEGEAWRVVQLRVIKPLRRVGLSGLADILYFQDNGRLVKSTLPFPPVGKPGSGDDTDRGRRRPAFGRAGDAEEY